VESPILIDVWTADPSRRGELAELASQCIHDVAAKQPGFLSARIYQSTDGGALLVTVSMRTVKERQELMDLPETHRYTRELRAMAHDHARLFQLVESVGEPS
jgi:hypothetical protein